MQDCPVCHGHKLTDVVLIKDVPIFCNLLFTDRNKAQSIPRGDISLTYCEECGHLFNKAFDPVVMDYDDRYENALDFSPIFQHYLSELTDTLIDKYGLKNKKIVDVGCGQGDFLLLLCSKGNNTGKGYDPSHRFESKANMDNMHVTFIQDYYSEKYSEQNADFISSRHVLEHIDEPNTFIQLIKSGLKQDSGSGIFIEVPNGSYTIEKLGIWDLIYEHISYFTPSSLRYLMTANNLDIQELSSVFGDQYLTVVSSPGSPRSKNSTNHAAANHNAVTDFAGKFQDKTNYWRLKLKEWEKEGKKTVIWGSGSKGVTFLNILDQNAYISYAVDINPRKTNKFVAGSGHQIKTPEFLKDFHPDVVLIMNPIYQDEIKGLLGDMNVSADIYII